MNNNLMVYAERMSVLLDHLVFLLHDTLHFLRTITQARGWQYSSKRQLGTNVHLRWDTSPFSGYNIFKKKKKLN